MATNILTNEKFAELRDLSNKIDAKKAKEAISLAEKSDLVDMLGNFYFDVKTNLTEPKYIELLDGSIFEHDGETFEHDGLYALIADLAYSRYVYNLNNNLTPFGIQSKFTSDSNPVDRNIIKDISKQAQVDAGFKFVFIEKFILENDQTFQRYCKEKKENTGFNSMRISVLRNKDLTGFDDHYNYKK